MSRRVHPRGRRFLLAALTIGVLDVAIAWSYDVAPTPRVSAEDLPERQSTPNSALRSIPGAFLIDASRNASSSENPIASAASGDGSTFIISHRSNARSLLTTLLQKIEPSSQRVLWTVDVGELGVPLDVCVSTDAAGQGVDTLYFGKPGSVRANLFHLGVCHQRSNNRHTARYIVSFLCSYNYLFAHIHSFRLIYIYFLL